VLLCIAVASVRAEPIALLPLDAEARLEVYGQPVAGEIARALTDGKLEVVLVDAKSAIPTNAKLIIAGSIASQGTTVILRVQVRNPIDGTTTDKLEEPTNLAGIGKAAAKLSARLLPVVRLRLEVLSKAPPPPDRRPPGDVPPAVKLDPVMLIGIGVPDGASLFVEPLRLALVDNIQRATRAANRQPQPVDASTLGKQLAVSTVTAARAERGLVLEILDYTIEPALIPLARARVRVRIADASTVLFDRVLGTDTVVGDKQISAQALASRVAREVLTILRPHMKKLEPAWR
jgi:hypothetical protein